MVQSDCFITEKYMKTYVQLFPVNHVFKMFNVFAARGNLRIIYFFAKWISIMPTHFVKLPQELNCGLDFLNLIDVNCLQ